MRIEKTYWQNIKGVETSTCGQASMDLLDEIQSFTENWLHNLESFDIDVNSLLELQASLEIDETAAVQQMLVDAAVIAFCEDRDVRTGDAKVTPLDFLEEVSAEPIV